MDLFAEYHEYVFTAIAILYALLSIAAQHAAYENGARDAILYMREPDHPGTKRVKKYLEETQHEHL